MEDSENNKRKVGRPSAYSKDIAKQAYELALLGLTDIEMARVFGVAEKTIYNWQKEHPEFLQAQKDGKEIADAKVTKSLYRRATGYEHKAVKISANPGGEEHITEYVERYPPDTTACIFWLKNRQREKWRDRVDTTLTGKDDGPVKHDVTVDVPGLASRLSNFDK